MKLGNKETSDGRKTFDLQVLYVWFRLIRMMSACNVRPLGQGPSRRACFLSELNMSAESENRRASGHARTVGSFLCGSAHSRQFALRWSFSEARWQVMCNDVWRLRSCSGERRRARKSVASVFMPHMGEEFIGPNRMTSPSLRSMLTLNTWHESLECGCMMSPICIDRYRLSDTWTKAHTLFFRLDTI